MPRKTASRLELRKQAEAAEKNPAAPDAKAAKKKKKATKKRATRRSKDEIIERKRMVWVIYTATLREEARFPYDQRAEAEERLTQLLAKGKRTYFLQPVKELLSGGPARPQASDDVDEDEPAAVADVETEEFDDEGDIEDDVELDEDDIADDED
ncbi:MAG: hypothetical protein R3C12_00730 [Planctomycetaceae bacterium]|nr:hypothetical protein [Planctomycetaceae bacterium]